MSDEKLEYETPSPAITASNSLARLSLLCPAICFVSALADFASIPLRRPPDGIRSLVGAELIFLPPIATFLAIGAIIKRQRWAWIALVLAALGDCVAALIVWTLSNLTNL